MLKENIAIYVDRVGSKQATSNAFERIISTCAYCANKPENLEDMPETILGILKYQIAVLDYLHCNEGLSDEFCMAISKTKI